MNALWEDDTVLKLSNELPRKRLPNQTTCDRIREVLPGCFVLAEVSSNCDLWKVFIFVLS